MVLREDLARPADALITHAGPSWTNPPKGGMLEYNIRCEEALGCKALRQELIDEQLRHDRLFGLVHPKYWYFGHYHHRASHLHEGSRILQLDCAELVRHPRRARVNPGGEAAVMDVGQDRGIALMLSVLWVMRVPTADCNRHPGWGHGTPFHAGFPRCRCQIIG